MQFPYPAGKGAAPWSKGWPPGAIPSAGMSFAPMGAPSPWASPSTQTSWPGAYPSAAGWPSTGYPSSTTAPFGKQTPGFFGQPSPGGFPFGQPSPGGFPFGQPSSGGFPFGGSQGSSPYGKSPSYMSQPPAYQPSFAGGPRASDLANLIEPALSNVLPALQGLLQIPLMLLESLGEAGMRSQWSDVEVALKPGDWGSPGELSPDDFYPIDWLPGEIGSGGMGGLTSGEFSPGRIGPDGTGGWTPGQVSPGGVSPGEFGPGGVSPGEFGPGGVSPGEVSPGEVSPGEADAGWRRPGWLSPDDRSPGDSFPNDVPPGRSPDSPP